MTTGTANHRKNVMRSDSGHPNMEGSVRKGAAPFSRQFQVKTLVGVWEAKMAGGSSSTPAALEAVASTAPAGVVASMGSVSSSLIKRTSYRFCWNAVHSNMVPVVVSVVSGFGLAWQDSYGDKSGCQNGDEGFHRVSFRSFGLNVVNCLLQPNCCGNLETI